MNAVDSASVARISSAETYRQTFQRIVLNTELEGMLPGCSVKLWKKAGPSRGCAKGQQEMDPGG